MEGKWRVRDYYEVDGFALTPCPPLPQGEGEPKAWQTALIDAQLGSPFGVGKVHVGGRNGQGMPCPYEVSISGW